MRLLVMPTVALLTVACAADGAMTAAPPADAGWVSFETYPGPFCGACNTTKITVSYDGQVWVEQGHWAGTYRNWRVTRRQSQISVEAVANFRARLEPFRPAGVLALNDHPPCETLASDSSGVIIVWHDQESAARLDYNFGCDPEARHEMRTSLAAAPASLEIPRLQLPEWEVSGHPAPSDRIRLQIGPAAPTT